MRYSVHLSRNGFEVVDANTGQSVALRHGRYQADVVAGMLNRVPGYSHSRALLEWEPYGIEWGPQSVTLREAGV